MIGSEAAEFRGVGRVNIAGRRFCTGALISERLVLTAAHCLYESRSKRRTPLSVIQFVAGLNEGAHAAHRRVVRAATTPGYAFDGRASIDRIGMDVALLELDRPVTAAEAPAYAVRPARWGGGDRLTVVSYARDRAHAPSIQSGCRVRTGLGAVAALDCEARHGASGSPIFAERDGERTVVGLISAMGSAGVQRNKALVVLAAPAVETLMNALEPDRPARTAAGPAPVPAAGEFAQAR